jgi:hypothetical protein
MYGKVLACLATTALGAAIVTATPAVAFRGGGGGFHGGGFHGGGMHMGGGMHFGGGMMAGRSVFAPGGNRFVGARFAGRHMFVNRFNSFAFRHHRHFRNFAFVGAPFGYDYGYGYGYNECWRQVWTGYGWQWSNICYDYGY